jgi:cytochrome b6-f complex iron-sulfur subunit
VTNTGRLDESLEPMPAPLAFPRRKFLSSGILAVAAIGVGGVGASALSAFSRTLPKPMEPILLRPTQFPAFVEYKTERAIERVFVMPYPAASLSRAADVYDERMLAGMRSGYVALLGRCPRERERLFWGRRAEWFGCPDCGAHFNAAGEFRGGPARRGMDHFVVDVRPDGQLRVWPEPVFSRAPVGTDTTGQKQAGPLFANMGSA